jgi:hypothetical protein
MARLGTRSRFGASRAGAGRLSAVAVACLLASALAAAFFEPAASASTPLTDSAALASGSSPTSVLPGQSGQAAAPVVLSFSNTFSSGDTITVPIEIGSTPTPNTGTVAQSVGFYGTINVVATTPGGDTSPNFSISFTTNPADSAAVKSAGVDDEMVITFNNSSSGIPTDTISMEIKSIEYQLGASAGGGASGVPVDLAAVYKSGSSSTTFSGSPVTNAYIYQYSLTQTPVGVPTSTTGSPTAALSGYTFTEGAPGLLQPGKYSFSASLLPNSTAVSFTGDATLTASGFTIAAPDPSTGNCPTTGGGSVTVAGSSGYAFCVVAASTSSTGPGTLGATGMAINVPSTPGAVRVTLEGPESFSAAQPAATVVFEPRVAGQTADDTAAVAAESLYGGKTMNSGNGGAVILTSDAEYQDALSASFLGFAALPYQAVSGGTANMSSAVPMLLNPPNPPSNGEIATAAVQAIGALGATTVYIVGGTFAISQAVADQLAQIIVGYNSSGQPIYLSVHRIAGYTAEQTAAQVAESASSNALPATPGAYGRYNSGASESPSGPATGSVTTAILASSGEFQDALASSPLAYGKGVPILLNPPGTTLDPDTSSAISKLGVQQVIVVGGNLAVSDQVVQALIAQGVSVLRIAGTTYEQTAALLALFELNDYIPPPTVGAQVVEGLDASAQFGQGGPSLTVGTSRGDAFQDALSSAQVLGGTCLDVCPLLLTADTSTLSTPTAEFLADLGTSPAGGLTVFTNASGSFNIENILGDVVFGGTYAQTPALVSQELNTIAAG